eukprot:885550-Rhodomonas_salina.3
MVCVCVSCCWQTSRRMPYQTTRSVVAPVSCQTHPFWPKSGSNWPKFREDCGVWGSWFAGVREGRVGRQSTL